MTIDQGPDTARYQGIVALEVLALEPIPDGKYQGFTIAKWLPELVYEYYRSSGRHEKTGRPYVDTLTRLGLEEFREWSQLD